MGYGLNIYLICIGLLVSVSISIGFLIVELPIVIQ